MLLLLFSTCQFNYLGISLERPLLRYFSYCIAYCSNIYRYYLLVLFASILLEIMYTAAGLGEGSYLAHTQPVPKW